jgi:hypothetical protein
MANDGNCAGTLRWGPGKVASIDGQKERHQRPQTKTSERLVRIKGVGWSYPGLVDIPILG